MLGLLVHGLILLHHVLAAIYSETIDFSGVTHSYLIDSAHNKWKFATIWNYGIQGFYLSLCILEDLLLFIPSKSVDDFRRKVAACLNFLFASLVFPVACVVGVNFWPLFFYDREMIYPVIIETKLPVWMNHSLHTVVIVAPLLEMLVRCRPYPSKKKSLILLNSYLFVYSLMSVVTFLVTGTWVYPLLETIPWRGKSLVFILQHVFGTSCYFLGRYLNRVVWGSASNEEPSQKKNKKRK